jgi:crotonobetainyl-CoA:carnitine CoA-transferase CaiB-like acyl-CoA transferase
VVAPLEGIRVLDLSRFIAGPFCAQMLGDMGAEVIKVERPTGEDSRRVSPFYKGESVYVMMYNRNKSGITLDTRHPKARSILEQLVRVSDVLVENYRPGTLEDMGLNYGHLRELNPRLVVTRLSGFGQTGPWAKRALFDAIAQAMSGLMSLTGTNGDEPILTGTYLADYIVGLYGAFGTLSALYDRERTGEGQVVDIASLDSLVSCLGTHPSAYKMLGEKPVRRGSRDHLTAPATVFRAADRYVYLHAGTNSLFPRLCNVMGRPELATDERFREVQDRVANVDAIEAIVAAWVATKTADELSEILTNAGIPFGPVAEMEDVVSSPQLQAREMLVDIEHPSLGSISLLGIPVKLSASPGSIRKAPPQVGEDNWRIYGELLGLSEREIEGLRAEGAI